LDNKLVLQNELNMSATAQDIGGWKTAHWERSAIVHCLVD